MSDNKPIPVVPYPTVKAYSQGAGTQRASATQNMNASSQYQANANRALAGGKRRKKKSYRGGAIPAPQYHHMLYNPTGGLGTDPNAQMADLANKYSQMGANSKFDNLQGGNKQQEGNNQQAGGNPDWFWPCPNGGKKRTKKNNRKLRNNSMYRRRKSRKHRKSHKRNKSRKH